MQTYYPVIEAIAAEYDQVYLGNRKAWNAFENKKKLFTVEEGRSGTFYPMPRVHTVWQKYGPRACWTLSRMT